MTRLRPVLMLVVLVVLGAVGALLVATVLGMKSSELAHLAGLLAPAVLVTVAAAMLASWMLGRTTLRQRYVAVAAVGTLVALGNLVALTRAMFVSADAATVLAVVLVYASAAGLAAAFAAARSSATALDRITEAIRGFASGDLAVRVGRLDAGPELDRLASTLDVMASGLQRARDRAQRAEQMRRDLITAVSHDLRAPVSNIRAMVEAIDDRVVEDRPTLRRYAGEMGIAVGQLSSLVDDLFELVQVDAIRIDATRERLPIGEVVAAAVATVGAEADRKGIRIATDVGAIDGATCSPSVIRVLQNLLVNAVRHTPSEGTIRLEGERGSHGIVLTVEDSGAGIPERDVPFIFEPFYRGDAARTGDGAGLGLSIADRIVTALGGTIEVGRATDHGARFDVTLPIEVMVGPAASPGSPRTRSGGRRGSGSRRPS